MNHLATKLPHGAPEAPQAMEKCGLGDAVSSPPVSSSLSRPVIFSAWQFELLLESEYGANDAKSRDVCRIRGWLMQSGIINFGMSERV